MDLQKQVDSAHLGDELVTDHKAVGYHGSYLHQTEVHDGRGGGQGEIVHLRSKTASQMYEGQIQDIYDSEPMLELC
jgi:hypothetical protein